jgi:O-antigen ligase
VVAHIFAWLFVFAVPWQDMVVFQGLGTISKLLGITAMGAMVLHMMVHARVRRPTAFHWMVLVYLCWVLISTFWAVAEPVSISRKVKTYVQILMMVWVIWETSPNRRRLVSLMQAYVLGAYVAAGSTVYNSLTGVSLDPSGRYAASGFDANDSGMLMALALPLAWYLSSTASSGLQRWLNRGYFVAGSVAILLTGSRGALITMIAALLVVPFTLTQIKTGVKVAGFIIVILSGAAAVWLVPDKSFQRLSTTTAELSEGTLTGRITIWQTGLRAVPRRPLFGFGPAGWYPVAGRVARRLRGPHNTYLSILVEEGMIGLLLFLGILAVVMARLRAIPTTLERRVGLTLLLTVMIAIAPLGWDVAKGLWLVLALLAGFSDVFAGVRTHPAVFRPGPALRRQPRSVPTPANVR